MPRRFIDAPDALRCKAAILLKDKSGAQCGRYAKIGDYCTQHAHMADGTFKRREIQKCIDAAPAAARWAMGRD